ncbi:MAG: hypothetical protein UV73_C0001G0178 [Candidatus Gottesmanbacteria bacterium GW2011_GWA2_43_14]|uniref:Cupin type-2 domain-containing protein n=1 Tax=Candidatus Gottesmanbacteria bacterium GW2011_GWA2_43_14 TaxID=1618443 RepID=A0A0G1DM86_9BACT|nr:MAG: hypothetical protein UV73_C0001G0178 [Candidatus Gottesmanbacteria bacterium GW2011_GWA2_43_14]
MIIIRSSKIREVPASHESEDNPGSYRRRLFEKLDFPKGLSPQMINWARIPAGKKFRLHYHEDLIEIFIIASGRARIMVDGEAEIIRSGDAVMIPAKSPHTMEAIGKKEVEYLVVGYSWGLGGKTIVAEIEK